MEIEHAVKTFAMDADFEANVRKMGEEGFMLMPGIPPVVVYHVVRPKGQKAPEGATAKVHIDDSKVKILRNGELIDGT